MQRHAKRFRFGVNTLRYALSLCLLACLWLLWQGDAAFAIDANTNTNPPSVLTPAKWIYQLTPEQASKKHPVRIQGIVTFYDPEWHILFIQDASSGLYVAWAGDAQKLHPGQQVEIAGITHQGNYMPVIVAREFIPGKDGLMPEPIKPTIGDMAGGKFDGQWVEVRGRVRAVSNDRGRTQLMLVIEGIRSKVVVQSYPDLVSYGLLDADVLVRGVCGIGSDAKRQPTGFTLFVPGREYVTVMKANQTALNSLPIYDISSMTVQKTALKGDRIRMQGVIAGLGANGDCTIQDRTGSIRVQTDQSPKLRLNMFLDIVGYLNTNAVLPFIEDATLRRMGIGSMASMNSTDQHLMVSGKGQLSPIVRHVSAVRRLKPTEAAEGYPVQIIGVVTYYDYVYNVLFIQDETEGIFVYSEEVVDIVSGQRVRVQGYSAPGDYAPILKDTCFQILGSSPMPSATLYNYDQLATGSMDSQWVQIQGTVQDQQNDGHQCVMEVGVTNGMTFKATILMTDANEPLPQLLGAKIGIRGVCGTKFNEKRQLVGFQVFSPSITYVSILQSAPSPSDMPFQAITNLVQFKPDKTEVGRERFKGVVTAAQKDGSVYIQDDTGGLLVHIHKQDNIREGDLIDVTGFAELVGLSPSLKNAEIKILGRQAIPKPVDLTPELESTNSNENILQHISQHDSKRISVTGTLLNTVAGPVENVYLIQVGRMIVDAHWERMNEVRDMQNLNPECLVRVTGVAAVKIGRDRAPQSLGILMPSKLSLEVLRPPPGWVLERAMVVIGGLLIVGLAGSIWTFSLRRKVGIQTGVIQERLERELTLEKRYSDLVENAHDIIFTINTEGKITSMNKMGEELTGYNRTETKGIPLVKLLSPDYAEMVGKLIESVDSALSHTQTLELLAKDGARIMVEASTRAVLQEGRLVEIQVIARDISERVHLEMQLRQAQKMESVGQLAAGVAHDFNNILTIIQGHASMISNRGKADADLAESVLEISTAADRAAKLTKQLLAFSRKQMWKPCALGIHELIHDLAKMLVRALGEPIQLDIRTDPNLPKVLVDPGMMEQVLMNLAVNARDAMPEGGLLVITASVVHIGEGIPLAHEDSRSGQFIRIDVIDQGCGMDATVKGHLFEPFFTTKSVGKGSGLGLATAYGIVKQHQGWIEVQSEPGKGTSFHIYLPVTDKPAESSQHIKEERSDFRGTETILLVEDEAPVRELARKILVQCGYEVLTASNGGEALGVWELQRNKPALLFTDMVMPGGLNGRQLARRLQAKQPGLKVLYASGYSLEFNKDASELQVGINFLPKPYHIQNLVKTVRNCLDA